ncbi:MAG: hypothetical protein J5J06_19845 [Phycisphaerae bacterium]|nr:hypothetical protein [Phycisphaerae bacterium]
MKVVCQASARDLPRLSRSVLPVLLYGRTDKRLCGSVGAAVQEHVRRQKLVPTAEAWDLLSLALGVVTADQAVIRGKSPDGWTREIELTIPVSDDSKWSRQAELIQRMLRFLTTDIWTLTFVRGGHGYEPPARPVYPGEDCISLLSGGLDSLVGLIDSVAKGRRPIAVSQVVPGEAENQSLFAGELGGGLRHFQTNHNAECPGERERSQRSRSFIFLAYGVLAALSTRAYQDGQCVELFVSENGLISINPPLTEARLGSLSTRTTHPVFLHLFQELLGTLEIRVQVKNDYRFKTKGELLAECLDQDYLKKRARRSISCGRYRRNGFQHCGRCVPCQIRRAAFKRWGHPDRTGYVYKNLGKNDSDHSGFEDVRAAAMALAVMEEDGLDGLLATSLPWTLGAVVRDYRGVVERGLEELKAFLVAAGVR